MSAEAQAGGQLLAGLAVLCRQLLVAPHHENGTGRLQTWFWTAVMITAAVKRADLFVLFTKVQAGSQTAIQQGRYSDFWAGRRHMLAVVLGTALAAVAQESAAGRLKVLWRKAASAAVLNTYLDEDNSFYRMKLAGTVENPDHRITDDIRTLVDYVVDLASKLPEHLTKFVGLSGLMWRTSPLTCLMLWSYALLGTHASRQGFLRHLTHHELVTQHTEAHLRYALVRVGECAESIAFYGAAGSERRRLLSSLRRLVAEQHRLLTWTTGFKAFEEVYDRVGTMLPSLITAPLFWGGRIEFGAISQMFSAFRSVKEVLLFLANNYDKLASVAARLERLEALRRFPQLQVLARRKRERSIRLRAPRDELLLALREVRVAVPRGGSPACDRWLGPAGGISLELAAGDSLLIQGESGSGKSSLLRAVAGLWEEGVGEICRGPGVLFVPQTPYLPAGEHGVHASLRDQLLYPESQASDAALREALDAAGLGRLGGALAEAHDWATALSGGEKQRLVFARLLVQLEATTGAPLVLLDEATSACTEESEARLYQSLARRLEATGGALVSVGHRSSLARHHRQRLVLEESS